MHNISIYCIYIHYISGIEITVGGRENPTRNKKTDQKIQSFYRKNRLVFIFTTSFFFLTNKKSKKTTTLFKVL